MDKNLLVKMLHCDNPITVQEKAIQIALKEEDLDFILYLSENPCYAKNCAKIITSLKYERTQKYFDDLFSWIEDLNQPYAFDIFDYLKKAPGNLLINDFIRALDASVKRKNEAMKNVLIMLLKENDELYDMWNTGKTGDGGVS